MKGVSLFFLLVFCLCLECLFDLSTMQHPGAEEWIEHFLFVLKPTGAFVLGGHWTMGHVKGSAGGDAERFYNLNPGLRQGDVELPDGLKVGHVMGVSQRLAQCLCGFFPCFACCLFER